MIFCWQHFHEPQVQALTFKRLLHEVGNSAYKSVEGSLLRHLIGAGLYSSPFEFKAAASRHVI